ncbi:MAG: helical backbone metal receptor [Eubacterium sp.]
MKKNWNVVWCVLVMAGIVLAVSGCQSNSGTSGKVEVVSGQTSYPLTITDDLGTEVTLDAQPERIVSLSPANTEIVFALGEGNRLVGRTDYCNYPTEAAAVASIGDYNAPNVEKIVGLSPDLVLATDFIDDNVRKQLENTGAKVVVFSAASIDGVMGDIVITGKLINANDAAKTVVEGMEAERKKLVDACAGVSVQKSVFIDLGDYYSAGNGSLLGSMMDEINVKNIAATGDAAWPQLSVEQIIADNPDVYISFLNTAKSIAVVPGFNQVTAIAKGQIYAYGMTSPEADLMQRPGPRIVEGLRLFVQDIYPDLIK